MSTEVEIGDVERLRSIIVDRIGLSFDESKTDFLREVLERRTSSRGMTAAAYLDEIDTSSSDEMSTLALELTVPETYFFRNIQQFDALTKRVLPQLTSKGSPRTLHLLSAGCASGEEAYSLAIALRETLDPHWKTSIVAIDVNTAVLDRARQGRYSNWSLRETSPETQEKWFTRQDRDVVIDNAIAASVTFQQRNLVKEDPGFWFPQHFDIIFCRNVIMYFSPGQARAVITRFAESLRPGGYLFLGHAETLRGLSNDFHLCHTDGTFYYRRKESDKEKSQATSATSLEPTHTVIDVDSPKPTPWIDNNQSWYETIARANERIQQLTDPKLRKPRAQPEEAATPLPAPTWDLDLPLALLQSERFADALEVVENFPAPANDDLDVLLLRAALLTHNGRLGEAEETCHRLLAIDDLRADAHHVLALCREGARDPRAAIEQNQTAIYLDPTFALAHLHLAMLTRRAGDIDAARIEFARAATLLEAESGSRVLLFGGGFGREALIAFARSEMNLDGERQ